MLPSPLNNHSVTYKIAILINIKIMAIISLKLIRVSDPFAKMSQELLFIIIRMNQEHLFIQVQKIFNRNLIMLEVVLIIPINWLSIWKLSLNDNIVNYVLLNWPAWVFFYFYFDRLQALTVIKYSIERYQPFSKPIKIIKIKGWKQDN